MHRLFIATLISIFFFETQASWSLSSQYIAKPNSKIRMSFLTFENKKKKIHYKPQKPPYGLVYKNKVVINGSPYFVTGWTYGSKSLMFRVFNPQEKGAISICETISFAEKANIKMKDGILRIHTRDSLRSKLKWVNCAPTFKV